MRMMGCFHKNDNFHLIGSRGNYYHFNILSTFPALCARVSLSIAIVLVYENVANIINSGPLLRHLLFAHKHTHTTTHTAHTAPVTILMRPPVRLHFTVHLLFNHECTYDFCKGMIFGSAAPHQRSPEQLWVYMFVRSAAHDMHPMGHNICSPSRRYWQVACRRRRFPSPPLSSPHLPGDDVIRFGLPF